MSSAQAGKSLHSLQVLQISTGPAGFKLLGKRVELLPPFTSIHLPAPSPAMLHKVSQHLGADAKVKLSTGKIDPDSVSFSVSSLCEAQTNAWAMLQPQHRNGPRGFFGEICLFCRTTHKAHCHCVLILGRRNRQSILFIY